VDCALACIAGGRPVKVVCSALGVARSHIVNLLKRQADWVDRRKGSRDEASDALLVEEIRDVVRDQPSYGYPRTSALVRRKRLTEGRAPVNHKRIYRVMSEHRLLLGQRKLAAYPPRVHDGRIAVDSSNRRWCSDGFEIACHNKERVRVAFSLDCCDREAMSWVASTKGIDSEMVQDLMLNALEYRFDDVSKAPIGIEWLTDNGSCYTAKATRSFAKELGIQPLTTAIGSPQSNGMAESFVKTIKRDYVAFGDLSDAETVMEQLPLWFEHYNEIHPHSALRYLSPRMFRREKLTEP
jgi:putative transposase